MKLVSWYDNEWGYRYSPSLLSVRETDYIYRGGLFDGI